jgi:queuine tRNA-ribosyltransferase
VAGPIEEGCGCPACRVFSRGYIRHLLKAGELLGLRLVTLHNLHFYLGLMAEAREAIGAGRFDELRRRFNAEYRGVSLSANDV